jgi:3-oxoacyl-[acyl-carrier-protein] synthase-3
MVLWAFAGFLAGGVFGERMNQLRACITSVGGYLPERVVTNADLEKIVETSDEWIRTRTGIRERRHAEKGTATSDLAVRAAREALERRGLAPTDVELIIVATITPDMIFPAAACLVQDKLGATNAWAFDVSAACSGFAYALTIGAQFIETGAHRRVLVVGADVMTSITDFTDRSTCVLFGDGAGAVLLEPGTDGTGLLGFLHESDGSGACHLSLPAGGSLLPASHETVDQRLHYLRQAGPAVFKYASRKFAEVPLALLTKLGMTPEDVDLFVPHQANIRIINLAQERLGLPDERVVKNIDRYGNTTAATLPLALTSALEEGRLKRGDVVLFAAVGAGLTVGAVALRWSGLAGD